MAHPTDLAVNDRIITTIGTFAVVEVYPRFGPAAPVEVDVTPDPGVEVSDVNVLASVTGAGWAGWMSGGSNPRYRLHFSATADLDPDKV